MTEINLLAAQILASIADTDFAWKAGPEVLCRIHHDLFQVCIAQVESFKVERLIIKFKRRYPVRSVP